MGVLVGRAAKAQRACDEHSTKVSPPGNDVAPRDNESLENKGITGYTDCIADLWFFDIGGMILFSFDFPNWFFSHEVLLADWSQQPSFVVPSGELHNVGNYFSAKWPPPFYERLVLFSW